MHGEREGLRTERPRYVRWTISGTPHRRLPFVAVGASAISLPFFYGVWNEAGIADRALSLLLAGVLLAGGFQTWRSIQWLKAHGQWEGFVGEPKPRRALVYLLATGIAALMAVNKFMDIRTAPAPLSYLKVAGTIMYATLACYAAWCLAMRLRHRTR